MITLNEFIESTRSEDLRRDLTSNKDQLDAVSSPVGTTMKVVAGPGSGKTTVLVFRVLKLVFVDDVKPEEIMATTFTIKAANELKSRILSWGETIRQYVLNHIPISEDVRWRIENINFNQITAGTIDSISEEALTEYRNPGDNAPVIVDNAVALSLMNKKGYMGTGLFNPSVRTIFEEELTRIFGKAPTGEKRSEFLINLNNRLKENLIPTEKLDRFPCTKKCLEKYNEYLNERLLMDFPMLEQRYRDFMFTPKGKEYLGRYKFVLIDEYQDTNLLQESIFKELMRNAVLNGGSCMVVGDDDQSMYRFRGSRVYLFNDLEKRMATTGVEFKLLFLSKNYRSTPNIVDFYNKFVSMDQEYQNARIKKPEMTAERKDCINYPVLGMFRDTVEDLSRDLSEFILKLVKGGSYVFKDNEGQTWTIKLGEGGSAADMVILCSQPAEYSSNHKYRLPLLVNEYISRRGVEVFNPRGQELQNINNVGLICGLTLLCIDPMNDYLTMKYEKGSGKVWASKDTYRVISEWRSAAQSFIDSAADVRGVSLKNYVESWQLLTPLNGDKWKDDVTLVDIMYNLLPWIVPLHKELEGLVYLQAICRTADNSSHVNNFDGRIVFEYDLKKENGKDVKVYKGIMRASVKAALNDIFIPIASGEVDIDETLLSDAPYDKLDIMSMHQAKGLEFPITIVDVASDFSSNHAKQRFKRFPSEKDVDATSKTEDFLAELSPEIKIDRDDLDRCFDDLIRKFYVAFSRPQDVLLLVGLTPNRYDTKGKVIPNVGTGWTRDERWVWGNGLNNLVHL